MPMPLPLPRPLARCLWAAVLSSVTTLAAASPVVTDVNGAATPGDFVFGPSTIGWQWTAPLSFAWDGLASTFKTCCQFNILPPSQVTLLIATDTPANGGTTLFTGQLDANGRATFPAIHVTAGTSYFIGMRNLTGSSPFAVGVNIVNWVPAQPTGTVNLSGWYTGASFDTFIPQSEVNGVQQQPFSAPILRFEGLASAVPEPAAWVLLLAGLAGLGAIGQHGRQRRWLHCPA